LLTIVHLPWRNVATGHVGEECAAKVHAADAVSGPGHVVDTVQVQASIRPARLPVLRGHTRGTPRAALARRFAPNLFINVKKYIFENPHIASLVFLLIAAPRLGVVTSVRHLHLHPWQIDELFIARTGAASDTAERHCAVPFVPDIHQSVCQPPGQLPPVAVQYLQQGQ
jgi:hypothetical protein